MNTKVILKVDTLKNLASWLVSDWTYGVTPTYARALYIFANEPDTLLDNDATEGYSKFDDDKKSRTIL